jgi:hypothetical protein
MTISEIHKDRQNFEKPKAFYVQQRRNNITLSSKGRHLPLFAVA